MAIYFDGTNNDYASFAQVSHALDTFTTVLWFQLSTTPSQWNWLLVSKRYGGTGDRDWTIASDADPNADEILFAVYRVNGTDDFLSTNLNLAANVWTFMAITYDYNSGSPVCTWFKGSLTNPVSSVSVSPSLSSGVRQGVDLFQIGSSNLSVQESVLGFAAMFKKVLTQAEVQAIQFSPLKGSLVHGADCELCIFPGLHGASDFPNFASGGGKETADSGLEVAPADGLPFTPPFGFDAIGAGQLQSKLIEDVQIQDEARSIIYGHDTAVVEDTVRDFADGTLNVGATILGSGDSERISINVGDSWESLAEYVGAKYIFIEGDQYGSLGSGSEIVRYRTGASKQACEAAGWTLYTGAFLSSGWVQIKVER